MGEDGYSWWVCEVCGRDKFGMRRGETLNIKFRERQMTFVGGKVSAVCTFCGAISTINLDAPSEVEKPLLGR
jgi:hypothetical protein